MAPIGTRQLAQAHGKGESWSDFFFSVFLSHTNSVQSLTRFGNRLTVSRPEDDAGMVRAPIRGTFSSERSPDKGNNFNSFSIGTWFAGPLRRKLTILVWLPFFPATDKSIMTCCMSGLSEFPFERCPVL